MSDEEYDALDEELTRTVPDLGPNGSEWLSQREARLFGLNNVTLTWLIPRKPWLPALVPGTSLWLRIVPGIVIPRSNHGKDAACHCANKKD